VCFRRQLVHCSSIIERRPQGALILFEISGRIANHQPITLAKFQVVGRGQEFVSALHTLNLHLVSSPAPNPRDGLAVCATVRPDVEHCVEAPRRSIGERTRAFVQQTWRNEPEVTQRNQGRTRDYLRELEHIDVVNAVVMGQGNNEQVGRRTDRGCHTTNHNGEVHRHQHLRRRSTCAHCQPDDDWHQYDHDWRVVDESAEQHRRGEHREKRDMTIQRPQASEYPRNRFQCTGYHQCAA
jgi:hypothetical protein